MDEQVTKLCSMFQTQSIKPTQEFLFVIDFVLRELLNNAVEHGNKMNKEKSVKYSVLLSENDLTIEVYDGGGGFEIEDALQYERDEKNTRTRNRGMETINKLGFLVKVEKGKVNANIKFCNQSEFIERVAGRMENHFEDNKLICKINNNLIASNVKSFVEELKIVFESKESFDVMHIDLAETKSIDSMGITFLIGVYKTLMAQGKKMVLCGVSDSMLQLFKIMKLDETFQIQKS